MVPARSLLLSCLLVVALIGIAAPVGGAPPPRPFCDACGDGFETAAEREGVALSVERSTATVTVREDGAATWAVRNHLASEAAADRLRANASLLGAIAERGLHDAELLDATVTDDGIVVLRYRDPDFAAPTVGGALRSGAFTESYGEYRNVEGLGADRLTVVAPEGMRFGWTAPGASLSGDRTRMTLTDFEDGGFVTVVPRGTVLAPLYSVVGVATLVGPVALANVLLQVALPAAVVGIAVAAAGGALSWAGRDLAWVLERADAGLLAAGGLLCLPAVAAAGGVSLLGTATSPAFGVGVALMVAGHELARRTRWGRRPDPSYRGLLAVAAGATLLAWVGTVLAGSLLHAGGPTRAALARAPFVAPLFAMVPAGYALSRGRRLLAVGTAATGVAVATLPSAVLLAPLTGHGFLLPLLMVVGTAVAAALGAPLLVLGWSLGGACGARDAGVARP